MSRPSKKKHTKLCLYVCINCIFIVSSTDNYSFPSPKKVHFNGTADVKSLELLKKFDFLGLVAYADVETTKAT